MSPFSSLGTVIPPVTLLSLRERYAGGEITFEEWERMANEVIARDGFEPPGSPFPMPEMETVSR